MRCIAKGIVSIETLLLIFYYILGVSNTNIEMDTTCSPSRKDKLAPNKSLFDVNAGPYAVVKLSKFYMEALTEDSVPLYMQARKRHGYFNELILKEAIRLNSIKVLTYILDKERCNLLHLKHRVCYLYAIYHDHLSLVTFFSDRGFEYGPEELIYAIKLDRMNIINYMIDDNTSCITEDVLLAAILKGDLPLLTILVEEVKKIASINQDALVEAISNGDSHLLDTLPKLTNIPWSGRMYKEAINKRRLDIFQYLYEQGCPLKDGIILYTIRDINILKYLHEVIGIEKYEDMLDEAINEGNLEIIAYLYERGYPSSPYTDSYIILSGNIEIVKYFHEKGYTWDGEDLPFEEYNTEITQYCHDNNIPSLWNCESTCVYCMDNRKSKLSELWDMEVKEYDNYIQWLPRETMEDVRDLLFLPNEGIDYDEIDEYDEEYEY